MTGSFFRRRWLALLISFVFVAPLVIPVLPVAAAGTVLWQFGTTGEAGPGSNHLDNPHGAEWLSNGNVLIADSYNNRVIEVDPEGNIVWQYGTPTGEEGTEPNELRSPYDAKRLPDGNTLISDRDNHRVIEVRTSDYELSEERNGFTPESIVWQFGITHRAGTASNQLNKPYEAERLSDEHTLIADRENNRVIEVDKEMNIVWQYGTTDVSGGWPGKEINYLNTAVDANRLPNGNTLITDCWNSRVIEVKTEDYKAGEPNNGFTQASIVWQYGTTGVKGWGWNQLNIPLDAERLPNGNILISDTNFDVADDDFTPTSNDRVIEVDYVTKEVVWQYGTGEAGSDVNQLNRPYSAKRVLTGETLITDRMNHRVVLVGEPTPPTVLSTMPTNHESGVGISADITATFSEDIRASSISASSFMLKDAGNTPVEGSVSYADKVATFNPTSDLAYLTIYTATITTAAKDLVGNSLAADYTWSFTTEAAPTSEGGTGTGGTSGGGGGGGDTSSPATAAASDVYTGEIYGRVISSMSGWGIPGTAVRAGNQVVPTEPTGEFRITNLRSGIYTVYYDAPGFISQTQELILVSTGLTANPPAVIMSPAVVAGVTVASGAGEIHGRVVNTAGQPIKGTAVRIDNTVIPTNSGGEFRFTLVDPGIYTVYYDAPGYIGQTQIVAVTTGNTVTPPNVVLDSLGQIAGRVVNGAGRPMSGVAVRIDATTIPTNSRGEFRFTRVHSGVYAINYEAAGYTKQVQEYIAVAPNAIVNCPTVIMGR